MLLLLLLLLFDVAPPASSVCGHGGFRRCLFIATDADATSRGRGAKVDPRGTLRESRLRSRPV